MLNAVKALGMKRVAHRLLYCGLLTRSAGVALSLLLVGSAIAGASGPATSGEPAKQAKQQHMVGKKAVMHVYSYRPKTLEITSVTSQFFKDVDACESAVGGALRTATSRASEGDLVDAQCVAIDAPETATQPDETQFPAEVTEL
jgi:hypothetical protein